MKTLICDTETTGVTELDTVIELAWIVFDLEIGTFLDCGSVLVATEIENTARHINHIPDNAARMTREEAVAMMRQAITVHGVECITAHNSDFDRRMLPEFHDLPWVDSMRMKWPLATGNQKLTLLCADHGVPVFGAHRALADCFALANLMMRVADPPRSWVDPPTLLDLYIDVMQPRALYVLDSRGYNPAMNERAKAAGFRWNPDRKIWWCYMTTAEAAACPVPTRKELI